MIVIGIVGQPSSGKDTAANYVAQKGFKSFSGGDYMREQMRIQNIPTDRTNLSKFSTEMRQKYGMDYPLNQVIGELHYNTVISGARNTAEIKLLREKLGSNFTLIAIEVPINVRYERAKMRGRIGDSISFEKFKEEEDIERNNGSGGHNVDEVIKMADYKIDNSGTEQELFAKVNEILSKITGKSVE